VASVKRTQTIALSLCLIICCSLSTLTVRASNQTQVAVSTYGIVTLSSAPTLVAFGNTAIGTYFDQNDPNAQSISYFTSTVTQSVTDIVAYIGGASSGKATAALYAVSGSFVGALLVQSNSVSIGTTFSWVDFQFQISYPVTAGTTYGLSIMGNVPVNMMIVTGTGQRIAGPGAGSFGNGFTNPFGAIWGTDNSGAMSIYAAGTSIPTSTSTPTPPPTPTPIPTTTPSSANLEPLSAFYADMNGAASSYASLDNSVLHNGNPSIKVGPDYVRWTREVDGAWIRIHPGDHIVMSVWVKTDSCPSSTDPQGGACFGWDFETTTSSAAPGSLSIVDISSDGTQAGHPTGAERGWGVGTYGYSINGAAGLSEVNGNIVRVPWGTDWTLIQWDFIVPSTYYTYVTTGASFPNAMACNPVQIDTMVAWFEGRNLYDNSYAYFSEPKLYINP
jgi:hypothetical protein